MEENQQKPEVNNEGDLPGIGSTSFEISLPATLKIDNPIPSGKRISGVRLRRDYVYAERDKYINDTGNVPQPELMDVFRREAELSYPQDGDYVVKDGVTTYLGIG